MTVSFERFIDKLLFRLTRKLMQITCSRPGLLESRLPEFIQILEPVVAETFKVDSQPNEVAIRQSLRNMLVYSLPTNARFLIPELSKRIVPIANTWSYQNETLEWDIGPEETVLDVGSGGWPFKHATHLADKYPDQTSHRVEEIVRDHRPFFEADLESLPFADNAYDFVFCSHVLEHMENPGLAMRELMRVGSRGYIEVPTRLSDVMFNFTRLPNHHRWHCLVLAETLIFIEWTDWERRDIGNHYFDELQSDFSNAFQDFFERNRDLFFASLHWKERFEFIVIDKHGAIVDSTNCSVLRNVKD